MEVTAVKFGLRFTKQSAMKYTLLLLLTLTASSCSFFVEPKVTFQVENNTSKDLKILFYSDFKLLDSILINNGQKYESSKRYRPGSDEALTPFKTETDSLIISFEDGKVIQYSCEGRVLFKNLDKCHFEKNLMDFDTGTSSKKKLSDKTRKTISIEESDYDKAVFPLL